MQRSKQSNKTNSGYILRLSGTWGVANYQQSDVTQLVLRCEDKVEQGTDLSERGLMTNIITGNSDEIKMTRIAQRAL